MVHRQKVDPEFRRVRRRNRASDDEKLLSNALKEFLGAIRYELAQIVTLSDGSCLEAQPLNWDKTFLAIVNLEHSKPLTRRRR